MTIPIVSDVVTSFDSGNQKDHVINAPAYSPNDAIYIAIQIDEDTLLTGPPGFDVILDNIPVKAGDVKGTFSLFKKFDQGNEPASYTIHSNDSERSVMIAWSVSLEDGIEAVDTGDGEGATVTCPDVTTITDECLLMRIAATDSETLPHEHLSDDGYTMLASIERSSGATLSVQYVPFHTAGATGTVDIDIAESQEWLGITLAITPIDDTATGTDPDPPPPPPDDDPDDELPGTMADLIYKLRYDIGDTAATAWTDNELRNYLNAGIADYSIHFPMRRSAEMFPVDEDGTGYLSFVLPSDYVGVEAVFVDDAAGVGHTYLDRREYWRPDFYDPPGYYDVVVFRDQTRKNRMYISGSTELLYRVDYLAYHPRNLLESDYVTVPAHHWPIIRMYAVWMCSRKLQIEEQVTPTNTSALLMSQLSTNTSRLEESYVDALARALLGIEENPE